MASLTTKIVNGKPYLYLRETARVGGRSKVVRTTYLGKPEELARLLSEGPGEPKAVELRDFGSVAAAYVVARELQVAEAIDSALGSRRRSPSVGELSELAAINLAVEPGLPLADWFPRTPLARVSPLPADALSGRSFWDAMDRLSTDAIGQAEERIARRAVERYGLSPEAVVCDASSVATLVDSAEAAPASRLSSMALGVSLDGSVPLCHDIYHGDEAAGLPEAMAVISERLDSSALTLVSGKGNPAANQALARELGLGLVGSLAATAHQELLEVPPHEFRQLEGTGGALAYRTERELYGRKFTVVVCKSADWAESEARSFAQALHAAGRRLRELQGTVERGRHRMDAPACRKRVEEILRRRWLGEVVDVDFDLRARRFGFRTDEQVLARVRTLEFGKRIIFTDRHEWPDERIVSAYRAQGQAEEALAGLLQEAALASLAPDFRRTEQSLRVHAFHGTLALALVRLIEREVSRADIGLHGGLALPALAGIREAVLTYPPAGGKRGRPRVRTQLTTLDVAQRELFDLFRLGRLA